MKYVGMSPCSSAGNTFSSHLNKMAAMHYEFPLL